MASGTGHSKEIEELKLRGIGTFWFLDIGGKLKRLAILDDAQNVSLVNNVIFAGDKLYQVFTNEDSEIVVSEIEDVRSTTNTAQKIKGNNTVPDIDRNLNGENSGSAENAPNNAETNKESDDVVNGTEDACRNSSYDTETSFDRSGDGESARSAENVPHNVLSSSDDTYLHAFVTKSERDNAFSSDSDEDYNLEKGHEEYIVQKKKGIFRGIFQLLKKAVKRHPGERQKMLNKKAEPLYEDVPYVGIESAASNIGSDIEDEGRTDEDMTNITTNTDEVPGAKIVTALYDFKAFLDDEISFKKNDRFKICGGGNSSDSEWCSAEHLGTGRKGYIPRAYVTNNMSSLENMECWFNVDSHASETLLLSSDFPLGTFLLRPSSGKERQKGKGTSMCTLSMLFRDAESERTSVVHYKIKQHMGEVFIFADRSFSSISELLHYYKHAPTVRALCDFDAINDDDLSIRKGDKLELDEEASWWYNEYKKETDKQLLLPGNQNGTFLMRETGDAAEGLCCKLEIPCPKVCPLVQLRDLEVSRESVKLLRKLESGCFGEVYAGKWRNTVDIVVKTLRQGQMTADDFLAEAKLMHHLQHNKLVQLLAVCTQSEPIWIITERMINGALLVYLREDEGKSLQFKDLADMAGQIADGMAYLEMENCVHRNLRALSILVGDHNEVKIADFGYARLTQEGIYEADENTKFPKWTAPEAVFDRKFSIKSDVWSYGVLLYELITFGRIPYPGMNNREVLNRVEKGFRMPKPTGGPVPCPEPYYEIMLKCWNRVADSRPTFAYLEYFFNNYMVSAEGEYRPIDD